MLFRSRAFTYGGVLSRHGKGVLSAGAIKTAALATLIIVLVGSLMVLNAERDAPGASITSFGDSVWWAMETVTTVGYGDIHPNSDATKLFTIFYVLIGVGIIAASLNILVRLAAQRRLQKRSQKRKKVQPW